jgi:branched-chain amino acid transport system substrate-binding protein
VTATLAGCGTSLRHSEIIAAARGGQSVVATTGPPGVVPTPAAGMAVAPVPVSGGKSHGGPSSVPTVPVPGVSVPAGGGSSSIPNVTNTSGSGGGHQASTAAAGPTGPINIGIICDCSGLASSSEAPIAYGVQVWATMMNANGGLFGRQINVINEDEAGDGGRALADAKDLVQNHHVVAIVGAPAALTEASWANYINGTGVPVIGGDCATPQWNTIPAFFIQCGSPATQAFGVVKWGAQVVGRGANWGDWYCIESASVCGSLDNDWNNKGYAKAAGFHPVIRQQISLAQPDFTADCLGARGKSVRALTVLGDADTVIRAARSCSQQGYNPIYIQGSATVTYNTPQQTGLSNMAAEMPTFPFTGVNSPAAREFTQAYAKYGQGVHPSPGASLGWSSAKMFQKAAEIAGNSNLTSAGLIAALHTFHHETLGGLTVPMTFPKGKPSPDFRCWFVMQAVKGKWTAPHGDKVSCR